MRWNSFKLGWWGTRTVAMRPVIVITLVVCLAVAMAPWLTGGQEPVARLLGGGALLLGLILAWRQSEARRLRVGPLMIAFACLIGWAALSLAWTANQYSTAMWVVQWLVAGLAFRLAYTVAGEPKGRRYVVWAYLATAVTFAIVGIYVYLTGEYGRLTGSFWWANPAAAYLLPAVVLGMDYLRRAAGRLVWLWGALTTLLLAAFWLTDSRLTTAVLIVVVFIYLLMQRPDRSFWIRIVFTVLAAGVMSFGLAKLSTITAQHDSSVTPGSRYAEAVKGEAKSGSDRWNYLGSAVDMWADHPLGGVGAGAYGDVHPQYQQRVVSAGTNAHNLYAQVMAELGLFGIIALIAVVFWLGIGLLNGLSVSPAGRPLALGALGLAMHFGLDIDATYPALLSLFAVLAGLVYRQWVMTRGRLPVTLPLLAALVLFPLIAWYQSSVWGQRGVVAQDDGDYLTAAAAFERAHASILANPDYYSAEGIDLYALAATGASGARGADQMALERAWQAQRLDPSDAQHDQLAGRILAQRGDAKGAIIALRQALQLDPWNHPDYALDLASFQVRSGDADGGIKTARDMLKLYPKAVVDNRNFDITIRPALANLEALVGNVELVRGQYAAAGLSAQRALYWDARSLRGRALQIQVQRRTGTLPPAAVATPPATPPQ